MKWWCQGCSCASKMYFLMAHVASQNYVVDPKLSIFHMLARKQYKSASVTNNIFFMSSSCACSNILV